MPNGRFKSKKLRNKFIKSGVKMIGPDTIFFFKRYKDWKERYY